jgi:hypothetical protein
MRILFQLILIEAVTLSPDFEMFQETKFFHEPAKLYGTVSVFQSESGQVFAYFPDNRSQEGAVPLAFVPIDTKPIPLHSCVRIK